VKRLASGLGQEVGLEVVVVSEHSKGFGYTAPNPRAVSSKKWTRLKVQSNAEFETNAELVRMGCLAMNTIPFQVFADF
jgi:hypothetical protein